MGKYLIIKKTNFVAYTQPPLFNWLLGDSVQGPVIHGAPYYLVGTIYFNIDARRALLYFF